MRARHVPNCRRATPGYVADMDLANRAVNESDPHVSLVLHSSWVMGLRFLGDDTLLTAGSADWRTVLWHLSTHRQVALPRALTQYNSLSFSPDGSRLAAGSDGEGKLFDTTTGQAVLSFSQPGIKLAFARDGNRLLAVHGTGASVFEAPPFDRLQFDWLKEKPSPEAPPYLGPDTNYPKPDRP